MYSFVADEGRVWREIRRLVRKGGRILGAVSYLSDPEALLLKENDILVVDASEEAIGKGATSKAAVRAAFERAEIYTLDYLHSKMLIIGRTLVVGSMNASARSRYDLTEAAIITNDQDAINDARDWIRRLTMRATKIDDDLMAKIQGYEVFKRPEGRRRGRKKSAPRSMSNLDAAWWYIYTPNRNFTGKHADEAEQTRSDLEKSFKKVGQFVDTMEFVNGDGLLGRLKIGDHVFWGWGPRSKARAHVMAHCKVCEIEPFDDMTYIHITFPKSAENKAVPWKDFQDMAQEAEIGISKSAWTRLIKDGAKAEWLQDNWRKT